MGAFTAKFDGSPNSSYDISIENSGSIPIDLLLTVYAEKSNVTFS
jgi:hypothetical protein